MRSSAVKPELMITWEYLSLDNNDQLSTIFLVPRVVCLRSFSKMGLLTFNAGRDEGGLNELTINESLQEIILIYLNMLVILN